MTTERAAAVLPAPRRPGRYRIGLVCLGNICRSPMAEVVLTSLVEQAGLGATVEVVSSGTGDWHVGDPMDRRAAATLTAHGYDASKHRAQQFRSSWLEDCDVVLAMDAANLADVGGAYDGRVMLFRDLDPRAGDDRDVPDPYYGDDDGFEHVLGIVRRTSSEIVRQLAQSGRSS
jgi:protein-tyrosine phosphatase